MRTPIPTMPLSHLREADPERDRPESATESRASADVRRAFTEAGRKVLANREAWRWQALDPDEAENTLDRLTGVLVGDVELENADPTCGGVAALALRLSTLLREELLADPMGLSETALLDAIRRIEACRVRLERRSHRELAFLLTGANALELVVEFAHDLRSPLTSIMFLSETLRKGQSGEINQVQREQLGIMYSAALGMVGVANDLMDLASSEVDSSWGASRDEAFSLQELVENVRNMVTPMAEQKRLDISFYTPEQDHRRGQPVLLSRILLNLLTNAIKFTDHGRVEIVVEEEHPNRVSFSVHDTGRGMDTDDLDSLTALFGRSESRTGYHFSGTGLGLSICRRMVEKMGGELKVESRRGEGTRFHFSLPLPRTDAEPSARA